jgi:hypothetical protein
MILSDGSSESFIMYKVSSAFKIGARKSFTFETPAYSSAYPHEKPVPDTVAEFDSAKRASIFSLERLPAELVHCYYGIATAQHRT